MYDLSRYWTYLLVKFATISKSLWVSGFASGVIGRRARGGILLSSLRPTSLLLLSIDVGINMLITETTFSSRVFYVSPFSEQTRRREVEEEERRSTESIVPSLNLNRCIEPVGRSEND